MIMPRSTYYFLFALLVSLACNISAQSNGNPEIRNERSMYAKVYLKTNGDKEAIISSSPIHYKKNDAWEEINTTITSNNNGYKNESNVIQAYFPNSIAASDKIKLIVNANDELFIHSEKELVLVNEQNDLTIIAGSSNNSIANVNSNKINYSNIYTNISDEFKVLAGQVKNNVVLTASPDVLNTVSSGYFGFRETLELPRGWRIATPGETTGQSTSSLLMILDPAGNTILTIPEPVFFDSYGLESDGANPVKGKYLIGHDNDSWTITTLVPVSWLKDVNTKYPVSLDPSVVLTGVSGGWQSPNNFVDSPAFVFLGVCCGNLTHRGWIRFNTSSIPTTSCITNVELQVNVTTVVSNTSELVFVNDVTGSFGPYGAINVAAYNDFGTGLYTSFTINGTGAYGYYSLGASANALLQAQLPSFQVALQFSNEPSTNYKIIDGTSSNLRVTYSACTLPIELLSFDATCDDGKVNLKWETAAQIKNDHFTIERMTNGNNYETIGTVKGAGNSSQRLNYSFIDDKPLEGTTYYSLKQTDVDGQFKYLDLVAVSCDAADASRIFPNPNSGAFIIEKAQLNSDIIITNILGQTILHTKITGERTEIDLSKQLNGIYFIQSDSKNGFTSKKIVISK